MHLDSVAISNDMIMQLDSSSSDINLLDDIMTENSDEISNSRNKEQGK